MSKIWKENVGYFKKPTKKDLKYLDITSPMQDNSHQFQQEEEKKDEIISETLRDI